MSPNDEFSIRTSTVILLCTLLACPSQGLGALVGVARLSGPLRNCSVEAVGNDGTAANIATDGNGRFNTPITLSEDKVVRVVVSPGASCLDTFTNLALPFQLSAASAPNAAAGSVGYGSLMAQLYFEEVLAANDTGSSSILSNVTTARQAVQDLYSIFNISLAAFQLDSLQLQPFTLLQDANASTRDLAVALIAVDAEIGALIALGAALLNASSFTSGSRGSTSRSSNSSSSINMTTFARAVAAEGVHEMLRIEALRQVLLAEQAAAAAAAAVAAGEMQNSTAAIGSNTDSSISPLPPSSPPLAPSPPSPNSLGGLYTIEVVAAILESAARLTNVTVPSSAVNATAAVIAGMAAYAEVLKDVALQEAAGVRLGLNPLNALITMTRLAVVQADAATQMPQLLGSNSQVLQKYRLDALSDRINRAIVNVTSIHLALGLPPPAKAVTANGAAHVVGPLSGCSGQATGVWDPSYEDFATTSSGLLTLAAKGQGFVTVAPYRNCQDGITLLQLSLSVSNLGSAMSAVSVSPVAMLAQGFYTLQATEGPWTISLAQQTAAFAAMGLNLTAYNAFMIPRVNGTIITTVEAAAIASNTSVDNSMSAQPSTTEAAAWASPPPPAQLNATAAQGFNLSHPLMGAVMAANVQLVGLIYAARAMFATSCSYAYDIASMENADTLTASLTVYGAVVQAVKAGGVLNLASTQQLHEVFKFVMTACYFNSKLLSGNTTSDGIGRQEGSGTFLAGGSGSAIGATVQTSGRRRRRHRNTLELLPSAAASASAASAIRTLPVRGLAAHNPALHRRLQADLFARAVTGPEPLLLQRLAGLGPQLMYSSWDPSWGGWRGGGRSPEGEGAGTRPGVIGGSSGGAQGDGEHAREVLPSRGSGSGPHVMARSLAVYVDDADIATVYDKVATVLAGINTKLQDIQNRSQVAATAAASGRSISGIYNLTDLAMKAAELGYVVQQSFYRELADAMSSNYSSGLPLVDAVKALAEKYTGVELQKRMVEAPINRVLICESVGSQCSKSPPSSSPRSSSSSSSSKSNTALYVGVGLGVGLGLVALLLAAWVVRRTLRNRQVTKAVVDNFKAGDHMQHMAVRLRSAVPLDGAQFGVPHHQGQPQDIYRSLVPAALGSDPTVAQDYPLYPVRVLSASAGAYQYYNNGTSDTSLAATGGKAPATVGVHTAAAGSGDKGDVPGQPPVDGGDVTPPTFPLPQPRFAALADRGGSRAALLAAAGPVPLGPGPLSHQQHQDQQLYVPPLTTPSQGNLSLRSTPANGVIYKTYANYAFVRKADVGHFSDADAAALRDNLSSNVPSRGPGGAGGGIGGSNTLQKWKSHHAGPRWPRQDDTSTGSQPHSPSSSPPLRPPPSASSQLALTGVAASDGEQISYTVNDSTVAAGRSSLHNTAPLVALPRNLGPRPASGPKSSDGSGPGPATVTASGGGGGGGAAHGGVGLLNVSIGRRLGLPPLAPYTSVTNSAAPTAALNASLRAIPVNTNFNSSLRPPVQAGSKPQSQ